MLPIFNRAHFHQVCGLELYGAVVACQVIDLFIQYTPSSLDALDEAIEAQDGPTAQRLLHVLRGSAAGMGGEFMADLCQQLQRQGESTPAPSMMEGQRIREAFSDLVRALHDEHARLSAYQ